MKDQEKTTNEHRATDSSTSFRPWRTRVLAWTLGAVMGGMAVGAVSHAGMGYGCGHFGHGPWAVVDDDAAEERRHWIGFGIERILTKVDASEQQKAEVKDIVDRLATEMLPMREQFMTNRKALLALLTQPEIDRTEMETLRSRQIAQADEMSRQVVASLGDAAAVLTPEQRTQLVERFERFRH